MFEKDAFDLTGRVALITGASSYGIGSASARLLALHGARVFLTARREDKLKEVADEIIADGGVAAFMAADVSNEEECKASVDACIETFGKLDIMVLSAGICGAFAPGNPDVTFDSDNWRKVNSINLDGVFWMIKHGHAECAKGGVGSIIPISSLAAWKADGSAAYTATKGAIRSLTHNLGKEFAPKGIRINSLYPGLTDTDMTHGALGDETVGPMMLQGVPLGYFGTAEDMAYAVLFLASDASRFMTGQHIVIDGGMSC